MICPTCKQKKKRSLPQNSRLHKLFQLMQDNLQDKDGHYQHAMWWKINAKDRWLGYSEFRRSDGSVIQVLRSTSDCDVQELNEFMTRVEAYAAKRGVYLED